MDFVSISLFILKAIYLGVFAFVSIDIEKAIHRFISSLTASKRNLIVQQKENFEKEYFYTWEDFYDYKYDKIYITSILLAYFFQMYSIYKNNVNTIYLVLMKDMFINAYCVFMILVFFLLLIRKIKKLIVLIKKLLQFIKKKE